MTFSFHAHLASRAAIRLTGPEWRSFLHNLLTQDVETMAAGEARFAALLTPQGRLLYDLFVVADGEGALLDVEAQHRDALLQRLTMYRLRAKVEIGPDDRPISAASLDLAQVSGWVRDPRLPELGWRSYGARESTSAGDESAYESHRLALGVPGPADWGTDRTYPIEANFDLLNGIDFKKGCFVGQETTSRMKRRGTVKTRMLPVVFEGAAPPPGTEVLAGELRAGEILSGKAGRAIAALRLDRIDGPLTAGGAPAHVERPGWFAQALGETLS